MHVGVRVDTKHMMLKIKDLYSHCLNFMQTVFVMRNLTFSNVILMEGIVANQLQKILDATRMVVIVIYLVFQHHLFLVNM